MTKVCRALLQVGAVAALSRGQARYWSQVFAAIEGSLWHLTPRDAKRIRRTLRWKYRRLLRQLKRAKRAVPGAFSARLKRLHQRLVSLRLRRVGVAKSAWKPYHRGVALIQSRARRYRRAACGVSQNQRLLRLEWPTQSRRIFSHFGWRKGPFRGRKSFHSGIDIAASHGSKVMAAAPGVVVRSGWYGSCGLALFIRHPSGAVLGYCHLSRLDAWRGMKVCAGQRIGRIGTTGSSTGSHLHFTVKRGARYIDPVPFLSGRRLRQAN